MHNSFQNILFWNDTVHILDELVCFVHILVLQIVNDKIESGFWNNINQGWQHLKSILSSSEYDKIMSKEIVILEYISRGWSILQDLELSLGSLSIIQLEVITSLEVDTNNRVGVESEVDCKDL